ncbi:outer membrane beta-barrel protein [Flavobacterium sp. LaA7.5]|nr:outer membrane beta-barrel protein [Flavobacterium salilacus subsp. altitudinum]
MSEKKNIDRLFQEKFKDFEAAPPEHVWENIEAELKKKKKRRVVPLWFKLSGAAAVLLIGMWLINPFGNEIEVKDNPVVNSNKGNGKVHDDATNLNNKGNGNNRVTHPIQNNQGFNANDAVASGNEDNPADANGEKTSHSGKNGNNVITNPKNGFGNTNNAVVNNNGINNNGKAKNISPLNSGKQKNNSDESFYNKDAVVYSPKAKNSDNHNNIGNEQNSIENGNNNAVNTDAEIIPNEKSAVAQNEDYNENTNAVKENTAQNSDYIISDKEVITDEAVTETVVDTAATEVPENELEKLLQEKLNGEKEDKDKMLAEESNDKKWNIKPQIAPVFYNSLSEGSPIDAQFAGNSKDYNNNLSYGVGVNYAVSDRVSIRSGINTVNLSYATRGIEFYASMSEQTSNISGNNAARAANLVVQSQAVSDGNFSQAAPEQTFNGSMLQEMGYIEVPVEMSYALINKKFGIDVIGGFSTLFLNNNNVSVVTTQGLSSSLGEAENLNNIHFSTNVGIGFKYRFFKSFQASFEPTFKYQVNTFSNSSGNFKPYFIGLYSGISFNF